MVPNSKKLSLLILFITSLLVTRAMFSIIDDPEGPNLLVVVVGASIPYILSLATYTYVPLRRESVLGRVFLSVAAQMLIVTVLYFCLK